ncbi:MAG: glutamate--tRNA ligase [Pseudomonadota bacterium]
MSVKLRFAPSPTGLIHVGNIRTALMNSLFCRKHGGTFLLRLDDTDEERSTEEFSQAIQEDLTWLGLTYDEVFKQSERYVRYNKIRDELIAKGLLYPCYETPEELERKRKRLLARGKPPIYDRSALALTEEQRKSYDDAGQKPHWRFKLTHEMIEFTDLIRGEVAIDAATVSDPVLIRADGSYLYTLCSVIDDADYKITHIIRGEDHVTNTAVQVQIFKAIGAEVPKFAHHPLLTDDKGEKLSKRIGGLSVRSLREKGLEPQTILSYLARIGTSDPVEPHKMLKDIVGGFDISRISHSPARFVTHDMENLNSQIVASYDFSEIEIRLKKHAPEADAKFWNGVKFNLKYFSDVAEWYHIIFGNPENIAIPEDKDYLTLALSELQKLDWSTDVWKIWTNTLKATSGRNGKKLFMPLRQALTGMSHGPEMEVIIYLLGSEKIIQRMENAIDSL